MSALIPPGTTNGRPATQDDLNSAARALHMVALSPSELRELIDHHEHSPHFAGRVIARAATQILAVKVANGARD